VRGAEGAYAVLVVMSCEGMWAARDSLRVHCKMSRAAHNSVPELIHDASNEGHIVQLCANTSHKL
jgi:hypothetical protein